MADDIILNKAEIIENCLKRIDEEYRVDPKRLRNNQTVQDAIILNLERACQAAIDLAMRVVRIKKLGVPKESRDAFTFLEKAGFIDKIFCEKMYGLVGFRNTAIHNYKKLDLDLIENVIQSHLDDFQRLIKTVLKIK